MTSVSGRATSSSPSSTRALPGVAPSLAWSSPVPRCPALVSRWRGLVAQLRVHQKTANTPGRYIAKIFRASRETNKTKPPGGSTWYERKKIMNNISKLSLAAAMALALSAASSRAQAPLRNDVSVPNLAQVSDVNGNLPASGDTLLYDKRTCQPGDPLTPIIAPDGHQL